MTTDKRHNVFPVVHRIREEIDFCFAAFYGNAVLEREICDREFDAWVHKGRRGPGQLTEYIDMLAEHLPSAAQANIFSSLANDCITVVKKSGKKESNEHAVKKPRLVFIVLLMLSVSALVFYLLLHTS
ncbi:MAG: hypothetical protein AAF402_07180 [Pseudomonadota bacterium]